MFRKIIEGHQRLKERIHRTRIPLSKNGQRVMALVYFSIPLIAYGYIVDYTNKVSDRNWGLSRDGNGEFLPIDREKLLKKPASDEVLTNGRLQVESIKAQLRDSQL